MFAPKRLSDLIKEYGLHEDDLNQPMKHEHRDEIAEEVGQDWESLATAFEFKGFEISDIKDGYREPKSQRIVLLREWKKRYGKDATYAKMVNGLEKIKNRELTELVLKLCRECTQKASTCVENPAKTRKEEQHNISTSCKSTLGIALVLILTYLPLISVVVLDIQTDISITLLGTSHECNDSAAMALWSPKFQESNINCSQGVGHDLPLLQGLFIGRENDIRVVMEKAEKANILNINGAPGFGKSTLAIHVGYRLVENCISVRYINMEELPWKILSEFTDEPERRYVYETKLKNDYKLHNEVRIKSSTSLALLPESSSTAETGYRLTDKLKKWSQSIYRTTYLIFDNTDVILEHSSTTFRTTIKFIDLITFLVENSKLHLHVLVISREQLLLLEHFDRWIIKELNQIVSIELLGKLAPQINGSQLSTIAELLQGCPLAPKVVGNILHLRGQEIIQELENELQQHPLDVLDKVSDHRQRFRRIMDLIFSKLSFLRCGYIISFFPGSFSKEAGIAILGSNECLEMYERHSLLDEYFLGHQHRYKIHRLIREYLNSKAAMEENEFQTRFTNYYTQFLLNYTNQSESDAFDEHVLETESKNIHLFERLLLSDPKREFSPEQLAVLAFLVRKGYITEINSLHNTFKQYLIKMRYLKEKKILHEAVGGEFIAHIVKYFYLKCKCESIEEYIEKCFTDDYSCLDIFSCEVVTELQEIYPPLALSQQEQELLKHIDLLECENLSWIQLFSLHFVCFLLACVFPMWFRKLISSLIYYSREPIVCTYTCTCEIIASIFSLIIYSIIAYILSPYKLLHIEVVAKWVCRYAVMAICLLNFLTSYCKFDPLITFPRSLDSKQQLIIHGVIMIFSTLIWSFSPNICSRLPICQ